MADKMITEQEKQVKRLPAEEQKGAAIRAAVPMLLDYAAVLAKHNGKECLPDLRDVVESMAYVWAQEDVIYEFNQPTQAMLDVRKAFNSAMRKQSSAVTCEQTEAIIHGLSVHAELLAEHGDLVSVWQCCRIARRLREDFAGQTTQPLVLHGNFEIDESDRFMKFGSEDRDHVMQGQLLRCPVLVFNAPIPAEQIPDGWHCYHLSGRNIRDSDRLWSSMPQHDYTGSVLTHTDLIQTKRNMMRINDQFKLSGELLRLDDFCKQNGFRIEVFDRTFPEQEQTIGGIQFG